MKRDNYERRRTWTDNDDDSITKRVKWLLARGWELVAMEVFSSNPTRICIYVRRLEK